jgi:hypothetical protein
MKNRKMLLHVLAFMALVLSLVIPAAAAGASGAGPLSGDRPVGYSAVDSSSLGFVMTLNAPEGKVNPMVAAGEYHTVGLKSDSRVVAVGDKSYGQYDVNNWNLN